MNSILDLPVKILCEGSPDDGSAIYVEDVDLKRRLYYGWSLQDIIEFERNKRNEN